MSRTGAHPAPSAGNFEGRSVLFSKSWSSLCYGPYKVCEGALSNVLVRNRTSHVRCHIQVPLCLQMFALVKILLDPKSTKIVACDELFNLSFSKDGSKLVAACEFSPTGYNDFKRRLSYGWADSTNQEFIFYVWILGLAGGCTMVNCKIPSYKMCYFALSELSCVRLLAST